MVIAQRFQRQLSILHVHVCGLTATVHYPSLPSVELIVHKDMKNPTTKEVCVFMYNVMEGGA